MGLNTLHHWLIVVGLTCYDCYFIFSNLVVCVKMQYVLFEPGICEYILHFLSLGRLCKNAVRIVWASTKCSTHCLSQHQMQYVLFEPGICEYISSHLAVCVKMQYVLFEPDISLAMKTKCDIVTLSLFNLIL
jgi:hypothetical protein